MRGPHQDDEENKMGSSSKCYSWGSQGSYGNVQQE